MLRLKTDLTPADQLLRLPQTLEHRDGFRHIVTALQAGQPATVDGAWGSACALLAAQLARRAAGPLLVVVPRPADVEPLCDDLKLFTEATTLRLPAWESEGSERQVDDDIYGERLRTLKQLVSRLAGPASDKSAAELLVVTSIASLMQGVPQVHTLAESTWRLKVGDTLDATQLSRWLTERRFHHTSAVELPGEFAIRGGILDVFAPDWDQPVRIELFGDEVESIRAFDVATQRSTTSQDEVQITAIASDASGQQLLTDYLPASSWVLLIEPAEVRREGAAYLSRLEQPEQVHALERVLQQLARRPLVSAAALAESTDEAEWRMPMESVERFCGDPSRVRKELDAAADAEVYLVASTSAELDRLRELFGTTVPAQAGRLHYVTGTLQTGFQLTDANILLLSETQLFGRKVIRRPARRLRGRPIDSFLDLRTGDLVVHLAHGIGRYRGIKLLEKADQKVEHLEIEFAEGTKVYVPGWRIDLVQKYIGGTKSRPALAKIGGRQWLRQKKAAEAAAVDIAGEMLELQAARAARPGIAFAEDSEWQSEFTASFPYQETLDQTSAWESIRTDMLSPRPMDRLLCGDVGFGKTELAMRAAFKAVDSGYQVALLVPTTILAEQHAQTFAERMAEFPFEIAKLSRFCSPAEQREVLEGLESGRIDIVIGTHRVASRDVKFKNLGLVIIDEEQRFGVEVKERLKSLRTTVDVLTMTATPIPRTLHMALVGVRDISNLETPPQDRLAVETKVTRFDEQLIRHAVMREMTRGGQVYFVHNRVEDIGIVARKLQNIVPEATLKIAHGQMPEQQLEQVMLDFIEHRFDLLLATTIVESGLDIPQANTIFINEADRYGLADLHQLRGRVGRYKHRAYCYLLIDRHKHVTPNAARRLRAIEEYSNMGAGFAIAMRDLEIRGAGNLLGTQQSGHIAAVGYELYCQLLENAVRQIKRLPPKLSLDVDIDLPGQAYFPNDYVPDMRLKIDLYRRLAGITSVDEIEQFREEMTDRFGTPPAPVLRMLSLIELKIDAAIWQVSAIRRENEYLVFAYTNRPRIEQLKRYHGRQLRIVDDQHAYVPIPAGAGDADTLLELAKSVLRPH